MSPATRYIIQVDRPGERVDMATIRSLLEGAGVALDPNYGPLPLNPQLGRTVVRGAASPDAREHADHIPGVRFFAVAIHEPASCRPARPALSRDSSRAACPPPP